MAVLEAATVFIPRGKRRDYQPNWNPELNNFAQSLRPSKREDGKLSNKCKRRGTQQSKGSVQKGQNTSLD